MKIKEGEKLPVSEFFYLDNEGAVKKVDTNSIFDNQKAIMFGVPGAFTKVCSAKHLPGYVKNYELAKQKGTLSQAAFQQYLQTMQLIPNQVEKLLEIDQQVKEIASVYKDAKNCLYLGRGFNFPVALEGALKLKEISYIHAEGYPAAEMKHGPIALIDENMPVFVIATKKGHYEKVVSNIQEIKSRSGKIIAIVN